MAMRGRPSEAEGSRSARARSKAAATSAGVDPALPLDALAGERLCDRVLRAGADEVQPRLGARGGDAPPRRGEHLDVLVALEDADEEHARLGRDRDAIAGEGVEVGERRELGGGLDAELADEAGRERRDRPHGVGVADAERAHAVGQQARATAAQRRAVQARSGAPVAVQLDDEPRARCATSGRAPPRTGSASRSRRAGGSRASRRTRNGRSA